MNARWLIEYDSQNEIYTEPDSEENENVIARDLLRFDGSSTFYCAMLDTSDESCVRCFGEPNHRIIEGDVHDGDEFSHFVLAKRDAAYCETVRVQHQVNPDEFIDVDTTEVFTDSEVVEIFLQFFRTRRSLHNSSFRRARLI